MKYPNLFYLRELLDQVAHSSAEINGKWVPARPVGYQGFSSRVRVAWKVFTGRADAVIWPEGQ